MKLNDTTNLRAEDYPDQSKWIGRLFVVLNSLITNLQQIFDGNIDYTTNIRSVLRSYDTSQLTYPLTFQWPHKAFQPVDLQVCKASEDGTPVSLLPAWDYDASTQLITVSELTLFSGGSATSTTLGNRYRFTIRVTV